MKASQAAINLMQSFESCDLVAYPDPGSKDGNPWTIGWGSTGKDIFKGVKWTQTQADSRFAATVAIFEAGVSKLLGNSPTSQCQFDGMVCLAYNIGLSNFGGSTLLRRHKAGDFEGAKKAFASWVYNDHKIMRGLVRRRIAESKLYSGVK